MRVPMTMAGGPLLRATAWAAIGLLVAHTHASAGNPPVDRRVAGAVSQLGWNLVRSAGEGNVVLSPLSVWETLAMAHAGARGATAAEIAIVLGLPDDRTAIAGASEALRTALAATRNDKIALEIGNRLWIQTGKAVQASFSSLLSERFSASVGSVDFASAPEQARSEINQWIDAQTAGRIDELLKPGTIDSLSRLVLSNAVYLKAPWLTPFDERATQPAEFRLTPGKATEVPFMNRTGPLSAGTIENATLVEIPYTGEQLSLFIAVPDAADGVAQLLAGLDASWLERSSAAMRRRPVTLSLPRFTARAPISLERALAAMGMRSAFEDSMADFSGIDGTHELSVSAVVHEGFIEVTEQGTEAAAATGAAISGRSASRPREKPLVLKADRPFVWAVVERASGAMIFAGVVRDPRD